MKLFRKKQINESLIKIITISFGMGTGFSGANAAVSQDSLSIDEVIVTAQKREQRLQDVPISISVLGGEELDRSNAVGALDILNGVPGVAIRSSAQGGSQISVRGVTPNLAVLQGGPTIGFYLDSMPFSLIRSGLAPDASVYDLQRVEVLRGPQGTLYGAGSLNGVVRVLTNNADSSEFDFKARSSISHTKDGDINHKEDIAVNVPIIEGKLAMRAVIGFEDRSGWVESPNRTDINDRSRENARLKINATPNDRLSVDLTYWYSNEEFGAFDMSDPAGNRLSDGREDGDLGFSMYGAKVTYEFDKFSVTSSSSYLDYENNSAVVLNNTPPFLIFDTGITHKGFTQELLFNSTSDGPWQWSAGAFYRQAEDNLFEIFATVDTTDESDSFAVFSQVTRSFMDDQLQVTAGLRYFEDEVTVIENIPGSLVPTATQNFDKISPKLSATWSFDEGRILYLSYSEGFRSGINQFNRVIELLPETPPADADTLTNYEIGSKGSLLDGTVDYDVSLFFIDWTDTQQTLLLPDPTNPGVFFPSIMNSGDADGLGFDISLLVKPSDNVDLGLYYNYNGLRYSDDIISGGLVLFPEGGQLNSSPKYTYGASINYVRLMSQGWTATYSAYADYTSELPGRVVSGNAVDTSDTGEAIFLGRVSAEFRAPNNWTVKAFVKNISNNRRVPNGSFGFPDWKTALQPRTVGFSVEYQY